MPQTLTSDRGPQFTSNVWFELCKMLNTRHCQTSAYHPEANGVVEPLHRRLKDPLKASAAAANWSKEIHWVLLGLRAQPREDKGLSPAESVFGCPLVLPNELLKNDEVAVENIINKFKATVDAPVFSFPRHNSSQKLPDDLIRAHLIWVHRDIVRAPLQRPYAVVARGLRAFTIQVGMRDKIISVAGLKPCTDAAAEAGLPQRRGWPPQRARYPPPTSATRRVTFSDPLVSTPSQRPQALPRVSPGTGFVLPRGEVLVRPGGGGHPCGRVNGPAAQACGRGPIPVSATRPGYLMCTEFTCTVKYQ